MCVTCYILCQCWNISSDDIPFFFLNCFQKLTFLISSNSCFPIFSHTWPSKSPKWICKQKLIALRIEGYLLFWYFHYCPLIDSSLFWIPFLPFSYYSSPSFTAWLQVTPKEGMQEKWEILSICTSEKVFAVRLSMPPFLVWNYVTIIKTFQCQRRCNDPMTDTTHLDSWTIFHFSKITWRIFPLFLIFWNVTLFWQYVVFFFIHSVSVGWIL